MLNYARQFFKIRVVFHTLISETKSVTPNIFCIRLTQVKTSQIKKGANYENLLKKFAAW